MSGGAVRVENTMHRVNTYDLRLLMNVCGATTCRASGHGVVGESNLASRASNTLAPSLSPRALTHAAASWPAVPPASADASGLICDWVFVFMSPGWVSSGHAPAG